MTPHVQWTLLLKLIPAIQMALFGVSAILLVGAVMALWLQANDLPKQLDHVTSAAKFQEKRKSPRRVSDASFEFIDRFFRVSKDRAELVNLSSQGACFLSVRQMPVGERFFARLAMKSGDPLRISCQVVWYQPANRHTLYGVKLVRV